MDFSEFESGQFRWWRTNTGFDIGVVRLIGEITKNQSMNDYGIGNWYVEVVNSGVRLVVRPECLGNEVPEMEVLAWSARS